MALATGHGVGIKGTTAAGAAFAVDIPFAYTYQQGVGIADVTRLHDIYRRTTTSIKQPGSLFLSAWWNAGGGANPSIPVGRELTSLTLALASGRSIATGTGGTAVIHQLQGVTRKGPQKQIVQYSIRFSGPVTPTFGPAYDIGELGTPILYELHDGEDGGRDYPRSTARRIVHFKHHAAGLSSPAIIDAATSVAGGAEVDQIPGSQLAPFATHPDSSSLFVHSVRVIERINPNESRLQVTYRDVDFLFGPEPGAIIVGSSFTAQTRQEETTVFLNADLLGIANLRIPRIHVRERPLIRRNELQRLESQTITQIEGKIDLIASQLGRMFQFPTDPAHKPYQLKGAAIRAINSFDDYVVAYVFQTEGDLPQLNVDPANPTRWSVPPAVPAFHSLDYHWPDATSAPVYTLIKPLGRYFAANASLPGSASVPYVAAP